MYKYLSRLQGSYLIKEAVDDQKKGQNNYQKKDQNNFQKKDKNNFQKKDKNNFQKKDQNNYQVRHKEKRYLDNVKYCYLLFSENDSILFWKY